MNSKLGWDTAVAASERLAAENARQQADIDKFLAERQGWVDEIEQLRAALQQCVTALESEEMQSVWRYLFAHGYTYKGPVIDMVGIKKLLEANP